MSLPCDDILQRAQSGLDFLILANGRDVPNNLGQEFASVAGLTIYGCLALKWCRACSFSRQRGTLS